MKYSIVLIFLILPYAQTDARCKKSISKKVEMSMIEPEKITLIAEIFNTKPDEFKDEGVIKVNFPRNDISLTLNGFDLNPFMGITSWIGFQKATKKGMELMAMGDLVLTEDEIDVTMSTALKHDIKVTALHNHFLNERPRIFFMHIEAEGTAQKLATDLKRVLDARAQAKKPEPFDEKESSISGPVIEKILGIKGTAKNGMFKVVIGRQIRADCDCVVGKNMGINTWAAFAGTDTHAMVDGDFAVLENELQSVLKALREANISVVAIHNHMTHEMPRMLFLHYIGYGSIEDLSQALKKALDQTGTKL